MNREVEKFQKWRPAKDNYDTVEVIFQSLQTETAKGYGFKDDGDEELTWLPKSQVSNLHELNSGYIFEIPVWLAKKQDLI